MKYHQLFGRFFLLFAFTVLSVMDVFSQQWLVDEIAEDNEGELFSGIIGTILFFGLFWFLGAFFCNNKKNNSNESHANDSAHDKNFDDDIELDYRVDDPHEDTLLVTSRTSTTPTKRSTPTQAEDEENTLKEKEFKEQCIEIYGDYAECTFGLVLIKEDGDYRQISYVDKRYNILSSYLFEHHRERYCSVFSLGNVDLLKYFIEFVKEFSIFPEAKPMDSHGNLEKEYYGERIIMMMAYYHQKQYPVYTAPSHSLRDYCLSLGWDLAIYIHRYFKQPMDWEDYHYLKDMVLHKMTKEDYLDYRSKAYHLIKKGEEGYFDGFGNRIGKSFDEAREVINGRALITSEQAMEEVKQFKWHL